MEKYKNIIFNCICRKIWRSYDLGKKGIYALKRDGLKNSYINYKIFIKRTKKRNDLYSQITDHGGAEWFKDVVKCKYIISEMQDHPFYKKAYKFEETYYWLNVPKWIDEDSANNSVTSVLDIGCAYGTLILYAKNKYKCDAFAIDITDSYYTSALSPKYCIRFQVADIENEQIPWNRTFDRILFTEVIEHLFDPLGVLKKIYGALSEDGKLFLSTPDADEWGKRDKYYSSFNEILSKPKYNINNVDDHIYQYDCNEIRCLLELAGFQIEKSEFSPGVCGRHFNIMAKKSEGHLTF
ncbi:class I SAM-dependent methyltransferase [bacterium]|nr:MAG: class I SAM-dependent methyltransferase [bacterium]